MSDTPLSQVDVDSTLRRSLDGRLLSLDLMRGLTIAVALIVFAARPVLEALPPSGFRQAGLSIVCDPLWHGMSLKSILQPAFLVIMGAAMFCSFQRRRSSGQSLRRICGHAVIRAFALIGLGILLDGWRPEQQGIRFVGPLQQIGICSFVVTMIAVLNEWKFALLFLCMALMNSWFLHEVAPIDQLHPDRFVDNHNAAAVMDAEWLPGRKQFGTWDQYGIASLLPATALAIAGLLMACYLSAYGSRLWESSGTLLLAGMLLAWECRVLSKFMPLNGYLWTPPFLALALGIVLIVAGLCSIAAARRTAGGFNALAAVGRNALVVTVGVRVIGPDAWPLDMLLGTHPESLANVIPLSVSVAQVSVLLMVACWLSARGRLINL